MSSSMKESSAESGRPGLGEEIANSITHGVGALLSIAGLVTLIVLGDNTNRLSFIVYGVTLVSEEKDRATAVPQPSRS